MYSRRQWVALYTIVRRESERMTRIASQVFLPPLITTTLYFLIFGVVIGNRVGTMEGVPYMVFIAPGLIMMSVITNAYSNVSSSLFGVRFQKSIDEMLVSPMHHSVLLWGFVLGGVVRGLVVGIGVFAVAYYFNRVGMRYVGMGLLVIILISMIFALLGFMNALYAKRFDDIMLVPTFILSPLTYLGGVFYDSHSLSNLFQTLSLLNPIWYMVSALRYAMLGIGTMNMAWVLAVISGCLVLLVALNMFLLRRGIGLRA